MRTTRRSILRTNDDADDRKGFELPICQQYRVQAHGDSSDGFAGVTVTEPVMEVVAEVPSNGANSYANGSALGHCSPSGEFQCPLA
ncbi:hypothetical protein KM043_018400 [Ampulex compressa]|nr:hypothetical protein KM043_018400 [Ampulex compressa]